MVWVVFAVVVCFLVVGFGLLMIFLVGSDVSLDGFRFFFSLGFVAGSGSVVVVVVVVVSGMGWICNGGCYGFLDLGLDAMVRLGFMGGGGSSRPKVREGEWGFGCENQKNH